jgi:4-amino-4-deoxy-L-arabinose transferase-like glycosyltransferase
MTVTMASFWFVVQPAQPDRLSRQARWWFFVSLGWGLLAKGPVALVLSGLSIAAWLILSPSHRSALVRFPWVRGFALTCLIAGPWYWAAEQRTPGFLSYFLIGEHFQRFLVPGWQGDLYGTAHLYPRGTIWLFLLYMLMPWTILLPLFLWRHLWKTLKSFIIQARHRPSFLPDLVTRGTYSDLPFEDRDWRVYLICWGLVPVLFFTFSANIIMPYVLPGIPALALLGASLLAGFDERLIDRLLFTGLSIMLVGSLLFVLVFPFTGYGERRSQRSLIQLYEQLRAPESRLVYFGQYPFSAGFYSNHSVRSVFDLPQLSADLDQSGSLFVALPNKNSSPELRDLADRRLEKIRPFRRFTLFQERSPSGSS